MNTLGATTPTGKVLFDAQGRPIKETAGEAAAQVMGFRPERIASMSAARRGFVNVEYVKREKYLWCLILKRAKIN